MQTHQIKRKTPNSKKKIVGRGGKRGKTSGKGHKGQKARAGSKMRPEMRDIIKRLPKRRGYGKNRARTVNPNATKYTPVNIAALDKSFADGDAVTSGTLVEKGVLKTKKGRLPNVKILGMGEITKKVTVSGCSVSGSAKEKIEKAGGEVK